MRRIACLVAVAVLLPLVSGVAPAQAKPAAAFHAMACPDGMFAPDTPIECGFVRVPENRAHPNGRTITVAAAVLHASAKHVRHDPIVFLDGGPSFGAISPFATEQYLAGAQFTTDRDVILVDTRGTGLSTPRLGCPELDSAEVKAFYTPPSINSHALAIYRVALQKCRARLVAQGIDLSAYNSAESAADLEALRHSLGVKKWDLLALSADGVLGLTYMRMFPHSIRSAVIDSGMSTQMNWGVDYDRGVAQMLDAVFTGCETNAACNATYPGLRGLFFKLIKRLQAHPLTITFPDFLPKPVKLVLDGVGLYADAIYNIFPGDAFSPSEIPDLLHQLWRRTHHQLVQEYRELVGTGPVVNSHADDDVAQGKSLSYICHDQSNFLTKADLRQAAQDLPPMAPRYLSPDLDLGDGFTGYLSPAGCAVWNVGRAAAVQHQPVSSSIPTLVLAGEYDEGVPSYVVKQVMAGLTHGHYYEFPASAHLQLASYTHGSDCARMIATQFLNHPRATPDSSCLASVSPVDFTP